MNYIDDYFSPIGRLTVSVSGDSLNGLWLEGQKYFPSLEKGYERVHTGYHDRFSDVTASMSSNSLLLEAS